MTCCGWKSLILLLSVHSTCALKMQGSEGSAFDDESYLNSTQESGSSQTCSTYYFDQRNKVTTNGWSAHSWSHYNLDCAHSGIHGNGYCTWHSCAQHGRGHLRSGISAYHGGGGVGTMRKYLQGTGRATLIWGDCWGSNHACVKRNGHTICTANHRTHSETCAFDFNNNDRLEIQDCAGNSVIMLRELKTCVGPTCSRDTGCGQYTNTHCQCDGHCVGSSKKAEATQHGCSNTDFIINCAVSGWGAWSACTKSCATGSQTRTRSVTQNAWNGGTACPTLKETRSCNAQACPVDCVVGAYGEYGDCSEQCDGGTQTSTRTNTAPQHGGKSCPTTNSRSRECNTLACRETGLKSWTPTYRHNDKSKAEAQKAKGDPHMTNIKGESFNIAQAGYAPLVKITSDKSADQPDLEVMGLIQATGHCRKKTFITRVNSSGDLLGEQIAVYLADQTDDHAFYVKVDETPVWSPGLTESLPTEPQLVFAQRAGKFSIKTLASKTQSMFESGIGIEMSHGLEMKISRPMHRASTRAHLNFEFRGLKDLPASFKVGGLLGNDDHSSWTSVDAACFTESFAREVDKFEEQSTAVVY